MREKTILQKKMELSKETMKYINFLDQKNILLGFETTEDMANLHQDVIDLICSKSSQWCHRDNRKGF